MTPTAIIQLNYADGKIRRMQFFAEPSDEEVNAAIAKHSEQPISWERKDAAWSESFSKQKAQS